MEPVPQGAGFFMDKIKFLDELYHSFESYYNIVREGVEEPFAGEAHFHSDDSMYFLVKAAKLSQSNSNEYIFFSVEDRLDEERLEYLDNVAWERGISRANPGPGHHFTDVSLVIIADEIDPAIEKIITKRVHQKSYRHMLWGFSNYRLVAIGLNEGKIIHNRQGKTLRKSIRNIYNSIK